MDWMTLKSGSDIRGVAVGEDAALTPEVAMCIGAAFAHWIASQTHRSIRNIVVSVGRDSRVTGETLLAAVAQGLALAGAQVIDFGLCTTPAMYMSTITKGFETDGAIMITASHHPWQLNGIKCFHREGGLTGKDIGSLLERAMILDINTLPGGSSILKTAFIPAYADMLSARIRKGLHTVEAQPLHGLHVVIDAGNGTGGFYATMLSRLGAQIKGSQFLDPNGMFPNHIPNPENEDAMASVCQAVLAAGADMGVIFDTDCDRVAVVDHLGHEINRSRLIAMVSAMLLKEQGGQTIVTDSVTSSGLADFIKAKGGHHHRYKRGYRNVIDEAIRLNAEGIPCPLAIETSGHAALKENHFLDDGMYLATLLIIEAMKQKRKGATLGALIQDLREPVEAREIRLSIQDPDFRSAGENAIAHLLQNAKSHPQWHLAPDNHEGIRVHFDLHGTQDSGWFLLRLSVHDPVMALNLESDLPGGIDTMLKELLPVLQACKGIDLQPLQTT